MTINQKLHKVNQNSMHHSFSHLRFGGQSTHINFCQPVEGNNNGLLTKREVKMAGYWLSSLNYACLWTELE